MEIMGLLSWIVFGLLAGVLAKWLLPGKDAGGLVGGAMLVLVAYKFIRTKI